MTILKKKRIGFLNCSWSSDPWTSLISVSKRPTEINQSINSSSNIVLKSNTETIAMTKTKDFIKKSLKSNKGIEGTIIIGTTSINKDTFLHEVLLNIQPLGWVYIPGGSKDEKQ